MEICVSTNFGIKFSKNSSKVIKSCTDFAFLVLKVATTGWSPDGAAGFSAAGAASGAFSGSGAI